MTSIVLINRLFYYAYHDSESNHMRLNLKVKADVSN